MRVLASCYVKHRSLTDHYLHY